MQQTTELTPASPPTGDVASPGRILIALAGLIGLAVLLWVGFDFLRSTTAPQWVVALVAIIWGVGGVAALFALANMLVEGLSNKWRGRIQPYIFVGPAVAALIVFLFIPALYTIFQSFLDASS